MWLKKFKTNPQWITREIGLGLVIFFVCISAVKGEESRKNEPASGKQVLANDGTGVAQKSESNSFMSVIENIFSDNNKNKSQKNNSLAATEKSTSISSIETTADNTQSKFSSFVVDPTCKQIVLPYSITENFGNIILDTLKNLPFGKDFRETARFTAKELNWIPMDLEREIGLNMLKESQILDENKNKESKELYKRARETLNEVLKQLPDGQPFDFRIYVMKTNFGNATALPGGIIQVDRDLFGKKADPDFAYFVIAHEVAHILQRHQTKAYQTTLIDTLAIAKDLKDVLKQLSVANAENALSYAVTLKKLVVSFSEQQELQSDSCALRLMSTKYQQQGDFERVIKKIEKRFGPIIPVVNIKNQDPEIILKLKYIGDGILERHPNTSERIGNIDSTIKEISKNRI